MNMREMNKTYAVRYNVYDGRTGHIWGDRYESEIVPGPPEDAEEYVFAPVMCGAERGEWLRKRRERRRRSGQPGAGREGQTPDGAADG
jgi:hypothetical protein